jgi:hypothetical protein
MNHQIENIRKTRETIINHVKELSLEKLNIIPHGFNNNILWNLGHLFAAQQNICYIRGGLRPPLSQTDFADFMPGTKPDHFFESDEEDNVKALLLSSVDILQRDYQNKAFANLTPYTTRYGIPINNIDDAIAFMQYHEGLHSGVIMSIRKLVMK